MTTASTWSIVLRKRHTKQEGNMSNKAKNSKESILCDAKELMKLYDQPYYRGCEFLGSHIRPNRIHLNNKTYDNAVRSIEKMNDSRYKDIDAMVSVFNSYSGLLKNRTDYKRLLELRDKLSPDWWQWLEWNAMRKCITCKQGYFPNERLNNKYHLKLKRYDTIRNYRAKECSGQRKADIAVAA